MNNYFLYGIVLTFGMLSYLVFSYLQVVWGAQSAVAGSITFNDALLGVIVVVVAIALVAFVIFFASKKIFDLNWK